MMSQKRGMGPSGWAPRRTHAVGTTAGGTQAGFDLLCTQGLPWGPGGQMMDIPRCPDGSKEGPERRQKRGKAEGRKLNQGKLSKESPRLVNSLRVART